MDNISPCLIVNRKTMNLSIQPNLLHKAENPWLSSIKRGTISVVDSNEIFGRRILSILNKLTISKANIFFKQIEDLNINSEDRLRKCVRIFFDKATSEPKYCFLYVFLARSLFFLKVQSSENSAKCISFQKLFITECQIEFDSYIKVHNLMEEMSFKNWQRYIGNICLIGELFKAQFLTENIVISCLIKLLSWHTDCSLECLCLLVRSIGKHLDSFEDIAKISELFEDLQDLCENQSLSFRIRFFIMDIIEFRERNWTPRNTQLYSGINQRPPDVE